MKVLIVAFHPRTMAPYSRLYEEAVKDSGNEYDIVFWDRFRDGALEKIENEYIIHRICTLGGNKLKKIPAFFAFRKTVKKIIKDGRYDRIVILNTMPGVLLSDILLKKYKNRFILDIRDYTYEKYGFYRHRVNLLIDHSFFSTISSPAFCQFLNRERCDRLLLNHNISNELQKMVSCRDLKLMKTGNIGFVGAVRHEKENENLIDEFGNDERFKFLYYGVFNDGCCLDSYCRKHNVENAWFYGAFDNADKPRIYENIDIINSVYESRTFGEGYSIPNRLYDAILFKKPMVVFEDTYIAQVVREYNLGLVLTKYGKVKNELLQYVSSFEQKEFDRNCERLLCKVLQDQEFLREKLYAFLREKNSEK